MTIEQEQWRTAIPMSNMQRTLFRPPTAQFLAVSRINVDVVRHWASRGWVSFEIDRVDWLDEPLCDELEFIRDVTSHGLSDDQVSTLLSSLAKPFQFDPHLIAYSFTDGWVQPNQRPTVEEIDGIMKAAFPEWLADAPRDRLDAVFDQILDLRVKCHAGFIPDVVCDQTLPAPWRRPVKVAADDFDLTEDTLDLYNAEIVIDRVKLWKKKAGSRLKSMHYRNLMAVRGANFGLSTAWWAPYFPTRR